MGCVDVRHVNAIAPPFVPDTSVAVDVLQGVRHGQRLPYLASALDPDIARGAVIGVLHIGAGRDSERVREPCRVCVADDDRQLLPDLTLPRCEGR
ncbi:MAG: hypothetical protein ACK559_07845, partial [bacterium]